VANVEVAEEQPAAQIASACPEEGAALEEVWWTAAGQATSNSGCGGLTLSEQARVGSGCVLLPFGPMGPGSASVRPTGAT
jgi:hypothetical protein